MASCSFCSSVNTDGTIFLLYTQIFANPFVMELCTFEMAIKNCHNMATSATFLFWRLDDLHRTHTKMFYKMKFIFVKYLQISSHFESSSKTRLHTPHTKQKRCYDVTLSRQERSTMRHKCTLHDWSCWWITQDGFFCHLAGPVTYVHWVRSLMQ